MKKITYWSDYNCPFCYIGEANLKAALKQLNLEDEVELEMKAFELDPNAPEQPRGNAVERLMEKYRMPERIALERIDRIEKMAKQSGLNYNLADAKYASSFDAHRLTQMAEDKFPKLAEKLEENLYKAFFTENLLLSDPKVLKKIALETGLPEDEVDHLLSSDDYAETVRAQEKEAREKGIHGVPFFVIGSEAVSGAMDPDGFAKILKAEFEDESSIPVFENKGQACGPDGCK